jgi:hypothetical protein
LVFPFPARLIDLQHVLEFTESHPLRIGQGGRALRRSGRTLQAELGGTASPSPPRLLVKAFPLRSKPPPAATA